MLLGIKDIIDILLVAFILFAIYRILRRSGASNLIWGILAFVIAWLLVSYVFHLELTSGIFDRFVSVGAIALIVIFQEEIRSFFYRVGSRFNVEQIKDRWSRLGQKQNVQQQVDAVLNACVHMSASKTGALIIHNGRIWSAACILPVSKRTDLPKRYGLRHRAAIGLTEKTDAMAIVVSEETGKISVAKGEDIHTVTQEELKSYLLQVFGAELNAEEKRDNK